MLEVNNVLRALQDALHYFLGNLGEGVFLAILNFNGLLLLDKTGDYEVGLATLGFFLLGKSLAFPCSWLLDDFLFLGGLEGAILLLYLGDFLLVNGLLLLLDFG